MRVCSVNGCEKKHLARGLCSTHYNQQHQPHRHRKVTVGCDYCGDPCEKSLSAKYGARFCSLICRDVHALDRTNGDPCAAARGCSTSS